jgi:hypothetical protein
MQSTHNSSHGFSFAPTSFFRTDAEAERGLSGLGPEIPFGSRAENVFKAVGEYGLRRWPIDLDRARMMEYNYPE